MALRNFKASPLPLPPEEYNQRFMQSVFRLIEMYFRMLDSDTPNFAQSYQADRVTTNAVAVANLIPATDVDVGTRAFVTDATATTFYSVVAGGGANKVPVFSDGANWRVG